MATNSQQPNEEVKSKAKQKSKKAPEVTKEQVAEVLSVDNNVPEVEEGIVDNNVPQQPAEDVTDETLESTEEVAESTPVEPTFSEKTVEQLADEVARGMHGSGRERMISLGRRYVEVQQELNRRFRNQ